MAPVTNGVVVPPAILVQGPPEFGADCHCMDPVYPVKVKVTGLPPHIVVGVTLAVPGTGAVVVVMVTEFVADQQPKGPPVTRHV